MKAVIVAIQFIKQCSQKRHELYFFLIKIIYMYYLIPDKPFTNSGQGSSTEKRVEKTWKKIYKKA